MQREGEESTLPSTDDRVQQKWEEITAGIETFWKEEVSPLDGGQYRKQFLHPGPVVAGQVKSDQ